MLRLFSIGNIYKYLNINGYLNVSPGKSIGSGYICRLIDDRDKEEDRRGSWRNAIRIDDEQRYAVVANYAFSDLVI